MKKIIVAIVLILGAVAAFKYYDRIHTADTNRGRVEGMLRAMADKDEQTALCLWALNKVVLDRETMSFYYDRYLKFVSASGLDGSSGWAVAETKPIDDGRQRSNPGAQGLGGPPDRTPAVTRGQRPWTVVQGDEQRGRGARVQRSKKRNRSCFGLSLRPSAPPLLCGRYVSQI